MDIEFLDTSLEKKGFALRLKLMGVSQSIGSTAVA